MKGLYQRGYGREDVLELFRFIDWMMALPEELTRQFVHEIEDLEEAGKMTYMTVWERRGIEQGALAESRAAVVDVLEARFEQIPQEMRDTISGIQDAVLLRALRKDAVIARSLDEFRQVLSGP